MMSCLEIDQVEKQRSIFSVNTIGPLLEVCIARLVAQTQRWSVTWTLLRQRLDVSHSRPLAADTRCLWLLLCYHFSSLPMTSEPHASYFCWVAAGWKWLHVWFTWNVVEGVWGGALLHYFTVLLTDWNDVCISSTTSLSENPKWFSAPLVYDVF